MVNVTSNKGVEQHKNSKKCLLRCLKWISCAVFLAFVLLNAFNNSIMISNSQDKLLSHRFSDSFSLPHESKGEIQPETQKPVSSLQSNDRVSSDSAHEVKENLQSESRQSFVKAHCNLGNEEWWPPTDSWKRRTPDFLIIGAKKCGTTSLFKYMQQHPLILKGRLKEILFFIPRRFPYWHDAKNWDSKVLVEPSRSHMYKKDYPVNRIRNNRSTISFEATPDYILYSNHSSKAILCTIPWVKIVCILRNPIDRLFSHYNYLKDTNLVGQDYAKDQNKSFREWIQDDINRLRKAGVVLPLNASASARENFFGSQEESLAWKKYLKRFWGEHPVARSLYAFQLEEWFSALRSIGRDPTKEVKIIREENLKSDPSKVTNEIFKWLNLPEHEIMSTKNSMVTTYSSKLENTTREALKDFLHPYNQRLYKLLGEEWAGIWD